MDIKQFFEELKNYWGDRLPNPEHYPKTFEYYVKIFKYYLYLDSKKTK